MSARCARCGAAVAGHGTWHCLSLGRVLALIGGLVLLSAYFMPWFGVQGILLTGAILSQILGGGTDVRRFLPNAGEGEVALLRGLVGLFPVCGGAAVALALLNGTLRRWRSAAAFATGFLGVVVLAALLGGITQLPPGSSLDVGIWTMAAGGLALLGAAALELAARRGWPAVAEDTRAG